MSVSVVINAQWFSISIMLTCLLFAIVFIVFELTSGLIYSLVSFFVCALSPISNCFSSTSCV